MTCQQRLFNGGEPAHRFQRSFQFSLVRNDVASLISGGEGSGIDSIDSVSKQFLYGKAA